MAKTIHQGRNVKRFREMLGIKQEALVLGLGDEWNQQKISLLEQKETLEQSLLEQVAKVLKVPVEAIRNFDEEVAVQYIQNNYDNAIVHAGPEFNYYCSFNPLDKLMELVEENRRLYERLLESERRMS